MKDITIEQAFKDGIKTRHTDMENGEKRYRLLGADGSSYIRTEASKGCWENSHFHKFCKEMYIVQQGYIYFCELIGDILKVRKFEEGQFVITNPLTAHNVYMIEKSVTHTVKFGRCEDSDWNSCEKLDELTKGLGEDELEKIIQKDSDNIWH